MNKIILEDVSYVYQNQTAISNISIKIRAGEFISIIGPSGCGKSTLLSLLSGLNSPLRGNILLDGKQIEGVGLDRGMVFQHYSLFPWMSARKNVVFGLRQVHPDKSKGEIEQIADNYLGLVGLREAAEKYPAQLSGGMQQRVAIARAFAMNPEILLMDEPFGAVDAKNRVLLQDLLLKLWGKGEEQKTVIFVTHDIDEAILLSDRIIVMSTGPGKVKKDIHVDFSRPRDRTLLMGTLEYAELRNSLVNLLYDDLN